jgi:hypothetical protein
VYKEKFTVTIHITAAQYESQSLLQFIEGNAISYPVTQSNYVQLSSPGKARQKQILLS